MAEWCQYSKIGQTNKANDIQFRGLNWKRIQWICGGTKSCKVCKKVYSTREHHACCEEELTHHHCNVKFILLISEKRLLFTVHGTHTHSDPPPVIVPKTIKENVEKTVVANPNIKTQDVSKGIGIDFVPSQVCPALSLRRRLASIIQRARKKALPKVVNLGELKKVEHNLKKKEKELNDQGKRKVCF